MPAEILSKFKPLVTNVISLGSLANGAGRIGDVIDNTATRAPMAQVFLRTRTGASAPTVNTPIKLYLIRRSNGATDIADSALGEVDAAVTTEPVNAELIGSIVVTAATATTYEKSFLVYDLPPKYSIVVWNAIGQALDATAGNHILQIIPIVMEAQ